MMLNARQKVGVVVLVVGVGALFIDRAFVLPKGAPAGEQTVFVDDYTAPAAAGATGSVSLASTGPTVARTLETAWSDKNLSFAHPRNLFSLPGSWRRDSGAEPTDRAAVSAAARLIGASKLEAIIVEAEGKQALIDDQLIRLGEDFNGYELIVVNSESVILEGNGERIELRLVKGR